MKFTKVITPVNKHRKMATFKLQAIPKCNVNTTLLKSFLIVIIIADQRC